MKKSLLVSAGLLAVLGSSAVLAQEKEGNWMMRIRAVDAQPVKKWSDAGVLGLSGSDVYVGNKLMPEIDFSYFFTKNIAAELILTYPQTLTAHSKTLGKLGTFKGLPPTLTLQYHFTPDATFRPYVGVGVNYTLFSDRKIDRVAPLVLGRESWGGAFQVGADWKIGPNSFINVDVKKVYFDTSVSLAGTRVGRVYVNPVLIGVGYGFRF
jgi:outer membrane protein